jgi:predicted RNA-binding protein associated with RNAse of E/G family
LLARPGVGYSTSLIWDASWTLREWYVNFEQPLRPRSPIGFDYVDLALDLVVRPDGTHELLDEDELEEALERCVLTKDDAEAAYADAAKLIAEWPFPTGWENWRPDPDWEPPSLPAGWDVVDS